MPAIPASQPGGRLPDAARASVRAITPATAPHGGRFSVREPPGTGFGRLEARVVERAVLALRRQRRRGWAESTHEAGRGVHDEERALAPSSTTSARADLHLVASEVRAGKAEDVEAREDAAVEGEIARGAAGRDDVVSDDRASVAAARERAGRVARRPPAPAGAARSRRPRLRPRRGRAASACEASAEVPGVDRHRRVEGGGRPM